jgi:hypothetical protein
VIEHGLGCFGQQTASRLIWGRFYGRAIFIKARDLDVDVLDQKLRGGNVKEWSVAQRNRIPNYIGCIHVIGYFFTSNYGDTFHVTGQALRFKICTCCQDYSRIGLYCPQSFTQGALCGYNFHLGRHMDTIFEMGTINSKNP